MQNQNRHHREEDRGVIYRMNKAAKSQSEIAQAIGFSQGTVSKELKRNKGKKVIDLSRPIKERLIGIKVRTVVSE